MLGAEEENFWCAFGLVDCEGVCVRLALDDVVEPFAIFTLKRQDREEHKLYTNRSLYLLAAPVRLRLE